VLDRGRGSAPVAAVGAGGTGDALVEPVEQQVGRFSGGGAVGMHVYRDAREADRGVGGDRPFPGRVRVSHDPHMGVEGGSSRVGEHGGDLVLDVLDEVGGDASTELDDGGWIGERDRGAFGGTHDPSLVWRTEDDQGQPARTR